MGFSTDMTSLILFCISSVQILILWNGKRLSAFSASRGLRQGDPLSPYLFVLCLEVLGKKIQQAVDVGDMKAIKVAK